ncbi:hypothetical protein PHYBOEH_003360 [Phytophthora boehmeriae]|uniref:Uncharacterized protein n=1 Tax=Phytophthora boehmeriae TaxID=109152 RepID=A0A8T1WR28_9STRA|nr:hypothetical protein PHYBOEH_003360 [Phytophthora boehmeriae]
MEKDLRDAYAALKLLRADLVQTRRDKRALESTVKYLEANGPPPSAAQTRESRETQQMKNEDVSSHLFRVAQRYEARIRGYEDKILEMTKGNSTKQEEQPEIDQDNQREEQNEVEKLALLAKLHEFSTLVEQQKQSLKIQEKTFKLEKRELKLQLEEKIQELQEERELAVQEQQKNEVLEKKVEVLEREKSEIQAGVDVVKVQSEKELGETRESAESLQKELQERTEKYEEERLLLERKLETHVQTNSILKQQLMEKEEACVSWTNEQEKYALKLQSEHELKVKEMTDELSWKHQQEKERGEAQIREEHQREMLELQQKYAMLELQRSSESEMALQKQDEAQERFLMTMRDLESNVTEIQEQLKESESKRAEEAAENEAMHAEARQHITEHEKTIRALTMEKKALQQELREANHSTKLVKEELLRCQKNAEQTQQDGLRCLAQTRLQCEVLEKQLMSAEDHPKLPCATEPTRYPRDLSAFHGLSDNELIALPAAQAWTTLRAAIVELGDFLPNLQTLLRAISGALTLCEYHSDVLPVLCEQLQGKLRGMDQAPIVATAISLVRFTTTMRSQIKLDETHVTLKLVNNFHKCMLATLAQWYEHNANEDDSDNKNSGFVPTPTFAIASRETALILQNWTRDRTKQLGVKRWLARMEAYPRVPARQGSTASDTRVVELSPEGCTLELEDMTLEVKDAFRLLLVPILKQNHAIHVRVFTRYTGVNGRSRKQQPERECNDQEHDTDKVWAMRIHVQTAATRRLNGNGRTRPSPLNLSPSPRGLPSPLAPISPASSVSSSTSSTASTRLQIIQERLQYLHSNG